MGATSTADAPAGKPAGGVPAPAPAADGGPGPAPHDGRSRGVSLTTRLALSVVGVAIVALIAGTAVVLTEAAHLSDATRRDALRALLAHQTDAVERFFVDRRDAVAALASAPLLVEAAEQLTTTYGELAPAEESVTAATDALEDAYAAELVPSLQAVTGEAVAAFSLLPVADPARVLQEAYVLPVLGPGSDRQVDDAEDGSAWSAAHAELNPRLQALTARLGFADLYLIDAATGRIIYSAGKAPDFATSLEVGPYSGGPLAGVVRAALAAPDEGVQATDLAPYAAYGGRPAGFLAAVLDSGGGPPSAVIAGAYTPDPVDAIMTAEGQWEAFGFGETGQTFVVGSDGRMRSVDREYAQNPDLYLAAVEASTTADERTAMVATGTTATFQRALSEDDVSGTDPGEPFTMTDHRGEAVVAAYQAVESVDAAPDWRVVAQVSQEEVAAPLDALRRRTFAAVTLGVLVATFFAVWWARRVFRPVRTVGRRLRRIRRGEPDLPVRLPRDAPAEFSALHGSVSELLAALDRQQAALDAALERRHETIRTVLPTAVAERFLSGDRRVVDEIGQASVVVLVTEGLAALVDVAPDGGRQLLGHLVHELDRLAERHGLARVKLVGHAYFAACGLEQPVLDHARRAVMFAAAAQAVVSDATAGTAAPLDMAGGVASGPVTVGLAGSALLVYDMWGATVDSARFLAQRAVPGEVLVSDRTRDILPPDVDLATRPTPDGTVTAVTGVPTDEAVGS